MLKPKKSVEEMNAYPVDLYKPYYKYKLDENENQYGPSPKVLKILSKIKDFSIKFYPCYGKLLEKLSAFNKLPMNYFLNTNGADEAINVIFTTYLEKGSKVLTVKPSFSMPKIYAEICGAEYIEIPYTEKWEFPEEEFLKTIDENPDLRIIHLTTPNNPTGDCIPRKLIEKIIKKASDIPVVVDETYAGYACNFNTDLAEKYNNVFILRSFSKDFALAGLRIGYIISNPENIIQLTKVRSPYSTNALAMTAAIAALDDYKYFKKIYSKLEKTKVELEKLLSKNGFTIYPTFANFVLVDFGEKSKFIYKKLLKNSIKIRKFDNNEFLKNTFRIGIPTEKGFDAIKTVFKNMSKDLLIFDMDGVLFDTNCSYRSAIADTYKFFAQKNTTADKIQEAKNMGGLNNDWDLTEYLLTSSGVNVEKQKIIDKFQSLYWNDGAGYITNEKLLINKELLEKLQNKYNLAIFTGRPKTEALFSLEYNGILKYFDIVVTMDDLPADRQKPHPDGISLIKEKLLFKNIFYFGDTPDDMICGNSAGINPMGVLPPQDKSKKLEKLLADNGATVVLDEINDILNVLEK